jgi:hypothetical protein
LGRGRKDLNLIIWFAVFILALESLVFANGAALITGLVLAFIGIYMEARRA